MIFWTANTSHLPTLALVHLGATETVIGLQGGLLPAFQLLQLPTLRAVALASKRAILVCGQLLALTGALPLVFFGQLVAAGPEAAIALAFASFVVATAGLQISNTVWFALLNAYMEPDRVGRFFGAIRTGWHLTLILFFAGSQLWLDRNPGSFGPLFALAWILGLLRILIVSRMPERSEQSAARPRVRDGLARLQSDPLLRRYLIGVSSAGAVRYTMTPFVIVMLQRVLGFTSAQIMVTTVAVFAGGLISLYLWGRVVDRVGPYPVFRATAIGSGLLNASLIFIGDAGSAALAFATTYFFLRSVLAAGHGLADTQVLFALTPKDAPSRTLVTTQVSVAFLSSLAPVLVGLVLDALLSRATDALPVYQGLFVICGMAQALSFLPLRAFKSGLPRSPIAT